jgi:hypothetical protein
LHQRNPASLNLIVRNLGSYHATRYANRPQTKVGQLQNYSAECRARCAGLFWRACDRSVQRVIELEAEDFRFDPTYPDVKTQRNEEFALIEILWSVGRSVKVKKKLLEELMTTLAQSGVDTENVMVCFKETSWENWAFAGGRLIHT